MSFYADTKENVSFFQQHSALSQGVVISLLIADEQKKYGEIKALENWVCKLKQEAKNHSYHILEKLVEYYCYQLEAKVENVDLKEMCAASTDAIKYHGTPGYILHAKLMIYIAAYHIESYNDKRAAKLCYETAITAWQIAEKIAPNCQAEIDNAYFGEGIEVITGDITTYAAAKERILTLARNKNIALEIWEKELEIEEMPINLSPQQHPRYPSLF